MASPRKPLRQPGLIVYFSGLGTSTFVLWLVYYLNESHDFNIMGWYINGILPGGAILVGVISGLGYAVASRLLQVKLSRAFVAGMLTTALLDYLAAQYLNYTHLLEKFHIQPERYGFFDYIRQICEGMTFRDAHSDKPGSPLGAWGYLFKLLEMCGYAGGAMVPSAKVFGMPYCRSCQQYLKVHRTGHLYSSCTWSSVKQLSKKPRLEALQEVVRTLTGQAREITAPLAAAPLADAEAAIAALNPAASKDAAARVTFTLKKCPTCDAHHIDITLHSYNADKQPATRAIASFDKTEPASRGDSTA